MDWPPGAHASTFGGNPLSLAAARETVRLIRDGYLENCRRSGELLLAGCRKLMDTHPVVGDVRGLGLMIGIEFVRDRATRERAPDVRDAVVQEAFKRGLLVLGAGPSTIRLSPPLMVDSEQCGFALETLDAAIGAATRAMESES
jgi:4-aminobutyrate aminotransferase